MEDIHHATVKTTHENSSTLMFRIKEQVLALKRRLTIVFFLFSFLFLLQIFARSTSKQICELKKKIQNE